MTTTFREQLLNLEYAVIEQSERLIEDIREALPAGRENALIRAGIHLARGLSAPEVKDAARKAVIQELLEFLENELNPHPATRPQLVVSN